MTAPSGERLAATSKHVLWTNLRWTYNGSAVRQYHVWAIWCPLAREVFHYAPGVKSPFRLIPRVGCPFCRKK